LNANFSKNSLLNEISYFALPPTRGEEKEDTTTLDITALGIVAFSISK
jgi:hypothetical protein